MRIERFEKDYKRGIRRQQRNRMRNRALRFVMEQWGGYEIGRQGFGYGRGCHCDGTLDSYRQYAQYWASRWCDILAKCSCQMCGNPRRHFKGVDGLTVQEKRFLFDEINQVAGLDCELEQACS